VWRQFRGFDLLPNLKMRLIGIEFAIELIFGMIFRTFCPETHVEPHNINPEDVISKFKVRFAPFDVKWLQKLKNIQMQLHTNGH
jgi:hypothetical protein